jgi:selenocysteine lyase/cysteine desulfurase
VPLALDVSQTAGAVPINMREMNVDVLAFTGHKALLGCTGIGGLCVRKHLTLRQVRSGGTGVRSDYPYHLAEYPWRMEYGTVNMLGVAALWAGQEWIESQGLRSLHERQMRLTARLVEGLRDIPRVELYCCRDLANHLSTVALNIGDLEAADVGLRLDVKHNIATRTGMQCAPLLHHRIGTDKRRGAVRFSIGPFNTDAHVDAAIQAVAETAAWMAAR